MSASIIERTIEVDGIRIFLRERPGPGPLTVFVHGNPTSSTDWIPFMNRLDGHSIAFDLPGFGRSARPGPGSFDYSVDAYVDLVARLLDEVAPECYRLVVHDWGVLGLAAALQQPERLERLAVINAVPLSGTYRWHWLARVWRHPRFGEAFCDLDIPLTGPLLRLARPGWRGMPPRFVEQVRTDFDAGTRRAILGLYRSADPGVLAKAGARLAELACPTLIVWGLDDPYLGIEQGRWYAETIPGAVLLELDRAGHWPWIDRPELIDSVADFLSADA